MSKLLLDEQPLLIMPGLAKKIGLNESIIIQQIHYWNEINKCSNNNYKDGNYWTFNSVAKWQEQFPFWSKRTIQRSINNLEKMKLLVTGNYNKLKIDRTKWYRIDYKVLETLEGYPLGQNDVINMTEWLNHLDKMSQPLPEINTESNSETTPKRYIITSIDDFVFLYYNLKYKEIKEKDHPTVTKEQLIKMISLISDYEIEHDVNNDDWKEAIDEHFRTLSGNNNGNILSFLSGDLDSSPILRLAQIK